MSGLAKTYRWHAENGATGGAVVVTVRELRKKYGSDGTITDEGSATTRINAVSVAAGARTSSSTVDNSSDKWTAADLLVTFAPAASVTGPCMLFLQISTDGGTTWPTDGRGIQVGGVQFASSSTAVTVNMRAR